MFSLKKIFSVLTLSFLVLTILTTSVSAATPANTKEAEAQRVRTPMNIVILIKDDLISRVGNELGVTRDFIRSLPAGSRVMVGYITSGSLQVRQPFTTDLSSAARSLPIPAGSTAMSPFNPYIEGIEAMEKFDSNLKGPHAV